ncbi:Efflux RND transporter periplasmic adaptor subunit [Nitrospira tepida]|uniref:Efflux RND transporter periplasmic adaptor subunit n=1 Tax=Nitrospira tepida TaxID=2973512 RepID=A0AA86MVE9_9BACT|nr:efflux RND transporter periplasmic adaptor subunit [Nitrospira tepida]CAI4029733.1 Efflux RND transporter periplasmic adaptor subunit [Nitrospira tepida]
MSRSRVNRPRWIGSALLLLMVVSTGAGLATWKYAAIQDSAAASANQPEPMESVMVAVAEEREHRQTTTSIGTVLALRSITLRNELAGTVRQVRLTPGQIVEAGTVLVALDVAVEEAELKAQKAQAALAKTVLARRQHLSLDLATAQEEVDRARADLDVALAQIARTEAIIARKTIRAPFRAKVGMADVHPGQYLNEGTQLTTLQGVDEAAHVDFTVAQQVAAGLREGERVDVLAPGSSSPIQAKIVAIDARVDPTTRNAMVRARIDRAAEAPPPGASVRVLVPIGTLRKAVAVPVSALRKGPGGDQVFVIQTDQEGKTRAYARQVESGAMVGDEVVTYAGLNPGERVAASGSFKLRDGVLVAVAGDYGNRQESGQAQPQVLSQR